MIRKRYDELKPGDVFRLTDGKTYILVAEVRERANGTMVEISGFRKADPPPNGQYNFSTRYLRDREVEVYSLEEIDAPWVRLHEWGAEHGRESYTFGAQGQGRAATRTSSRGAGPSVSHTPQQGPEDSVPLVLAPHTQLNSARGRYGG
jgi:hypothetical protein